MTDLLKQLLHQYGLLYITIAQLAKERPGTSHESLKDYYASLGPALPGEPTLVVKVSADGETRFTKRFSGAMPQDTERGDVTLICAILVIARSEKMKQSRLGVAKWNRDMQAKMSEK
jgi:hypothetical protein